VVLIVEWELGGEEITVSKRSSTDAGQPDNPGGARQSAPFPGGGKRRTF